MMLSDILDILPELHTVGIEFTVLRHKGSPCGLEISIQCLLAAQKEGNIVKIPPRDVE
jgi:hypothetical protein